jgi:hypothetical protein
MQSGRQVNEERKEARQSGKDEKERSRDFLFTCIKGAYFTSDTAIAKLLFYQAYCRPGLAVCRRSIRFYLKWLKQVQPSITYWNFHYSTKQKRIFDPIKVKDQINGSDPSTIRKNSSNFLTPLPK